MLALCVGFMSFSLFFISTGNGFLSAVFLILSLIAFMNSGGKGPNDDDQRPA